MSIVFVDLEHQRIRNDADAGASHLTRMANAESRLVAASGQTCTVVRYEDVTLDHIRIAMPTAMVISGNTADWSEYDVTMLAGLRETIRVAPVPILGICGGHQLIGHTHGATWGPLGRLHAGERDPDPRFAPGWYKERGYHQVHVDRTSPVFHGLPRSPVVFQSHYWHLTSVPAGFSVVARSNDVAIQAIARVDRPVFGVQFHPERFDDDRPDGDTILRNFFALARTDSTPPLPVTAVPA